MRKSAPFLILSTFIVVSSLGGAAYAQQAQPRENMPQQQDSHSDGTKPENMGSTGWTGGTGGSHIGTSNSLTDGSGTNANSEAAKDQPLTATGEDLKGPAVRFPAGKTPE
ncbi:MAG: hypothetical protein WC670_07560 [Pseudolabrys sp.]